MKRIIDKTLGAICVGLVGIVLFTCLFIVSMKDAEKQAQIDELQRELPTFGTIIIQNQDGVIYSYKGNNIVVTEENGEIRVLVDVPYEKDSCFQNKFQDKMSMEWDVTDETLMLRFVEYISPELTTEVKAWNILVILNRMLDDNYPNTISEIIQQEMEQHGESLDLLNSIEITQSDIDAMELVKIHKWDATGGSVAFQEVN